MELTASAVCINLAMRRNALRACLQNFLHAPACIIFFHFFDDDADIFTWKCIGDKYGEVFISSDSLPARPKAVDWNVINLPFADRNHRCALCFLFLFHCFANVTFLNSSIGCASSTFAPCATSSSLGRNPQSTPTANVFALRAVSISTFVSPK